MEHRLAEGFELADPKAFWVRPYPGLSYLDISACVDLEEAVLHQCLYHRYEQMRRHARPAVASPQHEQDLLRPTQQLGPVFAELLAAIQNIYARPEPPPAVRQVCRDYVQRVEQIDIVREVRFVETDEVPVIWTIIDSPPFQDDLRDPVYEAQLQTLSAISEETQVDFHIMNLRELPEGVTRTHMIPRGAKTIWRRSR